MKYFTTLAVLLSLTACSATTPTDADPMTGMDHGSDASSSATDRLVDSPRHHEWVDIQTGERTIHTWVVYPERSDKAPAVLIIHENRGLNDWARSLADQVAEAGYIAVAPDLLSGFSDEFDRTSDFADDDAARDALYQLDADQVQSDLKAVAAYAQSIDAANGKLATAGFCWGGAQSFEFATQSDAADAVLVFYGTSPEDTAAYANVNVPVYGFYGGNDERVNATIERADTAMSSYENAYEIKIYDGAGHAYMRSGEDPSADPANVAARNASWIRMKDILSQLETPAEAATGETFTGTIESVDTGCFADGECSVTIDGTKVVLLIGWSQEIVGQVIGADGIGGLEEFIGTTAEVYAAPTDDGSYTLYGSKDYYVKVLSS